MVWIRPGVYSEGNEFTCYQLKTCFSVFQACIIYMVQKLETHPEKIDLQSKVLDLRTLDVLFELLYIQFWLSRTRVNVFHSMLPHMLDEE